MREMRRTRRLLEAGDHKTLLAGYVDQVIERCELKLRNRDAAHDLAQTIFLRLWKELRAGKTWGGVPFRVVVGMVTTWELKGFYPPAKHDGELPETFTNPGDDFVRWIERHDFATAVAALPDGQRAVVERMYYGGRDLDEIARELGLEPNAVYQRLSNARRNLRERLGL